MVVKCKKCGRMSSDVGNLTSMNCNNGGKCEVYEGPEWSNNAWPCKKCGLTYVDLYNLANSNCQNGGKCEPYEGRVWPHNAWPCKKMWSNLC